MTIAETLDQDYKLALKAKDEIRVAAWRLLKTAIKNKEVDLRHKLKDEEIIATIVSQAKQRRDSIAQYQAGGRDDLVKREEIELAILEAYLPKQLNEHDLEQAIDQIIVELSAASPKDRGRAMKALMTRHTGQIDGKLAGELVKKKLTAV
ncbi:MAG: GatB/YqeY domain-containing protein [Deltaproteobacteria bacterium]|nr:GatB/YqeY domain-containing protein [Deltaproteobacteria bacterium]